MQEIERRQTKRIYDGAALFRRLVPAGILAFLLGMAAAHFPGCATTSTHVVETPDGGFELTQQIRTTAGAKQEEGATSLFYQGETGNGVTEPFIFESGSGAKHQEGESISGILTPLLGLITDLVKQLAAQTPMPAPAPTP